MVSFPSTESLTAKDFELLVKSWLEAESDDLCDFSASHLESMKGQDGEFTFDVTAKFCIFGGMKVQVVVECKKHSNPIKRELVQVLNEKKRSVGAHKAILVATAPFQSGAIEYAEKNGIGLVQIASSNVLFIKASRNRSAPLPRAIENVALQEPFVGLFYGMNPNGDLVFPQVLRRGMTHELGIFLRG
ncbi:restriction endonuclease [Acidovorax sp. NB1]|uniref:restriction endonuclease n=1 Tax=Acidovorax sp. NB1 TaxID=1943571 RepID=UPI0010CEAA1E|nr:restriction endonuclease [Acidovorax sp. NB1]GDY37088.1 hypothetical protein ACINB_29800 [Acidovorax sp. NB1]